MGKNLDKEINILLFWISGNINLNLNLKSEYYGCFNVCLNEKVITNITYKAVHSVTKDEHFQKYMY